ncbi:hypothetical protein ScPMuIL_009004 [Solemya velum]
MPAADIRKLRKKLRQIENLQRLERDLTNDELLKITRKAAIRENLLQLLVSHCDNSIDSTGYGDNSIDSTGYGDDYNNEGNTNASAVSGFVENDEQRTISYDEESDDSCEPRINDGHSRPMLERLEANSNEHIGPEGSSKVPQSTSLLESEQRADNVPSANREKAYQPTVKVDVKSKPHSGLLPEERENLSHREKVVTSQGRTDKGKNKEIRKEKLKTLYQSWWDSYFCISELEGHSDLVTCVDLCDSMLVTGSRDTTVKVWDLDDLREVHNLGGHTGTVTGVHIVPLQDSVRMSETLGTESDERLVISCSLDCNIKLWSVSTGHELRSVYTFNSVTCFAYCPFNHTVITGSDGGKIEMWGLDSGENLHSLRTHNESVTCLRVCDQRIYSASSDGVLKVFEIRDRDLACLFVSEDLHTKSRTPVTQRCIRSMAVSGDVVYFGDDGINIKALNWKKGLVHKLSNHQEDFGVTDALCCHGNILISSAYNLDNGLAYLNVRCLATEDYITTLNDDDTERMVCMACTKQAGDNVVIVTAGLQLKVCRMTPSDGSPKPEGSTRISGRYLSRLGRSAQDSDDESEVESTDSESESDEENDDRGSRNSQAQPSSWTAWCSIV